MKTNGVLVSAVLAVLGFFMQWLRARPWFRESHVIVAAVALGMLGAWLSTDGLELKPLIFKGLELGQLVLGGTMIGHMASHTRLPVPKYNSS